MEDPDYKTPEPCMGLTCPLTGEQYYVNWRKKRNRSCVPKEKKPQLRTKRKKILYFHTLYFNTFITLIFYTLRLNLKNNTHKISQIPNKNFHVISKKANCKYVAAKRKFKTTFKIRALLRSQHVVILGGSCQSLAYAQAQTHTLAATCPCTQTRAS